MVTQTDTDDFNEADCLCQDAVPKDKRIDFEEVRPVVVNGKPQLQNGHPVMKWKAILRFHRDCPIHGTEVTYAPRA
jgi:hypothetical protein